MKRLLAVLAVTLSIMIPAGGLLAQAPAKLALTDINTAPHNELESLPGIGREMAQAIIKGRPYKAPDDLVRRKIVPQSIYETIKNRLIAGTN